MSFKNCGSASIALANEEMAFWNRSTKVSMVKKTLIISMDETLLSISGDNKERMAIVSLFLLQLSLSFNLIWLTIYPRKKMLPAFNSIMQNQQALESLHISYHFGRTWRWRPRPTFSNESALFLTDNQSAESYIRHRLPRATNIIRCDMINLSNFDEAIKLGIIAKTLRETSALSTEQIRIKTDEMLKKTSSTTTTPINPSNPSSINQRYAVMGLDGVLVSGIKERSIFGRKRVKFNVRKGTQDLLAALQRKGYQIVIWASETKEIADLIIDKIDHSGAVTHRLYKESCAIASNKEGFARDIKMIGAKQVMAIGYDMESYIFGETKEFIGCNRYRGCQLDCDLFNIISYIDFNQCINKPLPILPCATETAAKKQVLIHLDHLMQTDMKRNMGIMIPSPHATEILTNLTRRGYEITVVSSEEEHIASPILDAMDPTGELISYRLYREHFGITLNNCFNISIKIFGDCQVNAVAAENDLQLWRNVSEKEAEAYLASLVQRSSLTEVQQDGGHSDHLVSSSLWPQNDKLSYVVF